MLSNDSQIQSIYQMLISKDDELSLLGLNILNQNYDLTFNVEKDKINHYRISKNKNQIPVSEALNNAVEYYHASIKYFSLESTFGEYIIESGMKEIESLLDAIEAYNKYYQ